MITRNINLTPPAAVFLDRDGTINPDEYGYIGNPDDYSLYPYAAKSIRLLRELGFYVFLVSNQSGIARGFFTIEQLQKVFDKMQQLLRAEDTEIDKIYYSPYFATGVVEPYNIEHEDRKPGLGMFRKAIKEFHFRPELSWMIGDRQFDIDFGKRAGMKTILVRSGNGEKAFIREMPQWKDKPDFVVRDLWMAAQLIKSLKPPSDTL